VQGLTLSLALFFLLILVPGYLGVNASGRMEEARNRFYPVLYHGIMNFGIVFIISLSVVNLFNAVFGIGRLFREAKTRTDRHGTTKRTNCN